MIVMGVDPAGASQPDWFQPGRYSIWAYWLDSDGDSGSDSEPILLAAYEWEEAGLRAIRADCVWQHEDADRRWDEHPEYEEIGRGMEAVVFARMIAAGKVHRIGTMPAVGRYAASPTWLDE
jgi:hypothetical protein